MRFTMIMFLLPLVFYCKSWGQDVDFRLADLDNRQRTFSELKGEKITIIDFWASWCRPCLRAMPELNTIHQLYQDKGVNIIGINCDGPRSASKVIPLTRSMQIGYTILRDIDAGLMKDLNLSAFPTLLITGSSGDILWVHEGFVQGDEQIIIQKIEKFLSE